MTKDEIWVLRHNKFCEIAILDLNRRYLIDTDGNIVDTAIEEASAFVYHFNPSTFHIDLTLHSLNGNISISPIKAYMITFFGDLPFDIQIVKNISVYPLRTSLRYILPDPIQHDQELELDGIVFKQYKTSRFYVSDHGIVYDLMEKRIMYQAHSDKGYCIVGVRRYGCEQRVHRLVFECWRGEILPGYEVHHKNEIEWDNFVENLDQLTPDAHKALGNANYKYSDQTVHLACEMMSKGLRPIEVANKLNLPYQVVNEWKNGARSDITSQYTFPARSYSRKDIASKFTKLTPDRVHRICNMLDSKRYTKTEIAKIMNTSQTSVGDIVHGKYWSDIASQYQFFNNPKSTYNHYQRKREAKEKFKSKLSGQN